jgi:hypothetical protein
MSWQHCEQQKNIILQLRVNMTKVEDGKEEVKHCFIHGQLYGGLCLCVHNVNVRNIVSPTEHCYESE